MGNKNQRLAVVEPEFRVSELDETSGVYDIMVAAPTDAELEIMWILQAITAALIAAFAGTIFCAILSDRRLTRSPFNTFILFSMFADLCFMIGLTIANSMNFSRGHVTQGACTFEVWNSQWSIVSTCWINMLMAREIHSLLRSSLTRKKYTPPPKKRVIWQCLSVYTAAGLVCGLPFIDAIPLRPRLVHGFVCLPYEDSLSSSLFQHLVYVQLQIGIPLMFVIYVCVDIYRKKLLPETGRRRELGLFLSRICVVLLVCMMPTLICVLFLRRAANPWVFFVASEWGIMYAGVSAFFVLQMRDVKKSVYHCFRYERESLNRDDVPSQPGFIVATEVRSSAELSIDLAPTGLEPHIRQSNGYVFSDETSRRHFDISETIRVGKRTSIIEAEQEECENEADAI